MGFSNMLLSMTNKITNLFKRKRHITDHLQIDQYDNLRESTVNDAHPLTNHFVALPKQSHTYLILETQKYTEKHQYASGLRFLFKYLDKYPENEDILNLVSTLVHSGMSLGNIHGAAKDSEELTDDLLSDTRLDTLFNECSECKSTWIQPFLYSVVENVSVMNAVGGQCTKCARVFCRACLDKRQFGVEMSISSCPVCGNDVTYIKNPTGRQQRQAARINLPLELVLFFREGPIPPDPEYLTNALKRLCPDLFEGDYSPQIKAFAIEDWHDISDKTMFYIAAADSNYLSDQYHLDRVKGTYQDDNIYIIRVYARSKIEDDKQLSAVEKDVDRLIHDNKYSRKVIEKAEKCKDGLKLFEIACSLFEAGNFTAALRYMEKASQLSPKDVGSFQIPLHVTEHGRYLQESQGIYQQSMSLFQNDKKSEAVDLLKTAKDITPKWAALYSTLGWYFSVTGQYNEAKEHLEMALEIDPFMPEAHNNFGMYYVFMKQKEKAKKCFKYALKLKPDYPEASQNLDSMESLLAEVEKQSKRTGEWGVLFWFNWNKISESGHSAYGRYVYELLLPHFAPAKQNLLPGFYTFFDGDYISDHVVHIPCMGREETLCLEEVGRLGADFCYLVAVFGNGAVDFSKVHQGLHQDKVIGYIGMTSCPSFSFQQFYDLTGQMALVLALNIQGNRLERKSFQFLNDTVIKSMGFELYDS